MCVACSALLCAGCLPHVMHGPRIEPDGLSGSLSLKLGHNQEIGEPVNFVPSLYGGLRQSFVSRSGEGPALSVGVQVPFFVVALVTDYEGPDAMTVATSTSYVDVYVQPRRKRAPGFETGIGVLTSSAIAAPYVQIGRIDDDGGGWYTTQVVGFSISDDLASGVLYMPSVVLRTPASDSGSAANFSAGLGFGFDDNGGTDRLFTLGVTIELGLGGS